MALPPSTTLSWQSEVIKADKDWERKYQRPIVYEFSNGQTFQWNPKTYTTTSV